MAGRPYESFGRQESELSVVPLPLSVRAGGRLSPSHSLDNHRCLVNRYARKLHYLTPFFCFVGNQSAKFAGTHWHWQAAGFRKTALQFGVRKSGIDRLVKRGDNL